MSALLIKPLFKQLLAHYGLWNSFDLVRRLGDIWAWLRAGSTGCAPQPIKRLVISSYLRKFALGVFVETGTYLGDTVMYIAGRGVRCYSIELSSDLYLAARSRLSAFANVRLINGDSASKLSELLATINEPTLFWLDGHYSAGITASADIKTPISAELKAIFSHPIKRHVILIDDARCFDGTSDYPFLDDLLHQIRDDGTYVAEVSSDIIRLTPRK